MHVFRTVLRRHGIALWVLCGLVGSARANDDAAAWASSAPTFEAQLATGQSANVQAAKAQVAAAQPANVQPANVQPANVQPAKAQLAAVQPASAPVNFESLLNFDIPQQPLAIALEHYARIAHLSIVVPSDMVRGRTSSPVQGRYSSEAALQQLLEGTGLSVESHESDAGKTYLLKQVGKPVAPAPGIATLYNQGNYPGLVQSRIWQALCANARTAPGQYRLLFQFQMDAAGHLADAHLLVSTGDSQRDSEVLDALKRVQVEPPPPSILVHQSVLMSLLPDSTSVGLRCGQGTQ